ncbi:MAG: hypothetical protein DRI48_05570 [Chloroflexi bacterium]|nr:MAG: hypothetical protein DRI48_05570 [Chloroflexota bacterium]
MPHQRPVDLPEDVLLIHYAALAPDASAPTRLRVLAAVGRLFSQGKIDCSLQDLCQAEQVLLNLRQWLEGEEGSRFWQLEGTRIISRAPCEKHILIGTQQLLDDLLTLTAQTDRHRLPDLDTLWQAASAFVSQQRVEAVQKTT